MGEWAYMIAAPMLWSSLSLNIRQAVTFTCLYCYNNNHDRKSSINPLLSNKPNPSNEPPSLLSSPFPPLIFLP